MPEKLRAVCAELGNRAGEFDPGESLDPEVEQFLRVNIDAYSDCLPQYIAHVIKVAVETSR